MLLRDFLPAPELNEFIQWYRIVHLEFGAVETIPFKAYPPKPEQCLHFFLRAYYDSTLKEEGFTVDLLSATNNKKFNRLTNPYDTTYYFADDSTGDVELWFSAKASITYTKRPPDSRYLKQYGLPMDVGVQISYVDLLDAISVKPNGFFIDQRSWVNQGYWSWKNLADALPYDYEPH